MKKRVLISTIFSGNATKYAITKLSPDKVVLVVEKNYEKNENEDVKTKKKSVDEIKKVYENVIAVDVFQTESVFNIYQIAEDIVNLIDKFNKDDYEILVHISEGTKTLSLGMTFATYLRKDMVEGLYYIIHDTNQIIKLPILDLKINESQKNILLLIKKGIDNTEELINKFEKSRSVGYTYLKELRDKGFVDYEEEKILLTDLGKLILV